ncbi:tRNA-splicing endonuclease subunit Sen2 [Allomyces arbusculus]|nr:tRNA-splicing endonuclease subunit Sen2 [Allomyces arbusculus]
MRGGKRVQWEEESIPVVKEARLARRHRWSMPLRDLDQALEQLQLLSEEAMFLAIHGMLDVFSAHSTGSPVTLDDLWAELGFATSRHAAARFAAYHAWRSRDPPWVPKCGLKYGADFVLYSKGPNHGHAPYAVRIVPVETADQVGQLPTQQDDATTAVTTAHHGVAWLQSVLRVVSHSKKVCA